APTPAPAPFPRFEDWTAFFRTPVDPPLGFTGPSGILPGEGPNLPDFIPIEDRWRVGFPEWDRYDRGHPLLDEYPYMPGRLLDAYNQNVFKGDYPIIGQHTFLDVTARTNGFYEARQLPTQTTPFESTERPFQENFFGRTTSFVLEQYASLTFDLFHGDAG